MRAPGKLLVLGAEGLAGRRLLAAAAGRGLDAAGASRRGGEGLFAADLEDASALRGLLETVRPEVIVNCAALTDLARCERDPAAALLANTRPPGLLAGYAAETGARFVQISTDHYYAGDGARPHAEDAPVSLLNEYARSKYAGEALALSAPGALVVRTNFVGWPSPHRRSFGEWALSVVREDAPARLFADQYVSSLSVWAFAEALLELLGTAAAGVLNLASREVFSKADIIEDLAAALGVRLTRARRTELGSDGVRRGDSLGLDVSSAEAWLGRTLPGRAELIADLALRAVAGDTT